jgi:hypothetical protein
MCRIWTAERGLKNTTIDKAAFEAYLLARNYRQRSTAECDNLTIANFGVLRLSGEVEANL